MLDIGNLDRKEKVFLAGCIKNMILSNGRIDEEEARGVEKIVDSYHFGDYDSALQEFENEIDRQSDFWELAQEIGRPEARETILGVLNEVSLQDGYRDREQSNLMNNLESIWRDPGQDLPR